MDYISLSKEVSYILRHHPKKYNLKLDENGFVNINELLLQLNKNNKYDKVITKEDLECVVFHSDKKRWEINGEMIRALYGHSTSQNIIKTSATPPNILYHGTTHKALNEILKVGLKPMSRQYVHMSIDIETAVKTGQRRESNPVILKIDSKKALSDGIKFYKGNEEIWLAEAMPSKYITVIKS